MNRLLPGGLLSFALAGAALASDSSYINNGTVTVAPNVDATNFINAGIFSISTPQLFKTQNTLNYSNLFQMTGAPGFDFALYQGATRWPAANFYNRPPQPNGQGGLIQATDVSAALPAQLLVLATNIHNQGNLAVGTAGLLRLVGTNISIPYSTLQVRPLVGSGAGGGLTTTVYDRYWGATNIDLNQGNIFSGTVAPPALPSAPAEFSGSASTPSHSVTNYPDIQGTASISLPNGFVSANTGVVQTASITITNNDGSTSDFEVVSNMVIDVAFVGPDDGLFVPTIRFARGSNRSNFFNTIWVQMDYLVTNTAARANDILSITVQDTLASNPNLTMVENYPTNPPSYRPSAISVTRGASANLNNGNALFDGEMLNGSGFEELNAEGIYAGYMAYVDNLAAEPPSPTTPVTNWPGRVEINAGTLDMQNAIIRGEGLVSIKARHLQNPTNTLIDCQNVSLDLASTNGSLTLDSFLVLANVERLHSNVWVWSGVWTNTRLDLITNNFAVDPDNPTNYDGSTNWVQSDLTNEVQVGFHVLIVGTELTAISSVITRDLALRATNVVDGATNSISAGFFTDAERFTLDGVIDIFGNNIPLTAIGGGFVPGTLLDFTSTNAPNLSYLTNNGIFNIYGLAHFGDDRAAPYEAIVNTGELTANAISLRAVYFENSGTLECGGSMNLNAVSSRLEVGRIDSLNDITIQGDELKMRDFTLEAGSLYLSLTNALFDSGSDSGNRVTVGTGFNLLHKPATGDLFGTHVLSSAPFGIVQHLWAGEDRGATAAGFSNNVAIGRLELSGGFGLLNFKGTGAHNGLYVDFLQIVGYGITNLQNLLLVDPSLTIYFAAASLPAEQLDGALGGRLRWVKDFAGPNSSVSVILPNGQTVTVNKAFRESMTIDSDADGLPNGADTSPFDGVVFSRVVVTNQPPPRSALITWDAAAGTIYRVEFTTSLGSPSWQFLMNYTNTAATNGPVTILDPGVPESESERYYRVSYGL